MKMGESVPGIALDKTLEARSYFITARRENIVHPAQEQIRTRVGGRDVRRGAQRFDRFVIAAARIESNAQADLEHGGTWVAFHSSGKHLDGGIEALVKKQFPSPIERVIFARLHSGG